MNKLLILLLSLSSLLHAQENSQGETPITNADTPVMTTEVSQENKPFDPRQGHWVSTFGFENLKYEIPSEFNGTSKSLSPVEQELWGGRLGFGKEFYLGAGFNTVTKLESYFVGTLFTGKKNLVEDNDDVDLSYIKKTGNVWGIDVVQSIGFLFDMKTKNPFLDEWAHLTVEPFIEGGVGMGWACHKLTYNYDLNSISEAYRTRVCDNLINTRIGGGVNLTSNTGYFLFLKAFFNNYDVTKRKSKTYEMPNGGSVTNVTDSDSNVNIDPVITYSLGGGYKF
jgi:hypothetical protein